MGLFSKKKKTTTTKSNETVVQSKIVKLTYLETLALEGGLATAGSLAGETAASTSNIDSNNKTQSDVNKFSDFFTNPISFIVPGTLLGGTLTKSLFGSSKSTTVTGTVTDSGWSLVKTWKQPQFDIIRYAIGIKELTVSQFIYEQVSEIVSVPWTSPKEISKVVLYVDQFIPKEFPAGTGYIEYYVKPDIESANWVRINGLGLPTIFNADNTIVPRIISFNTEKPVNSNLEESYVYTDGPVKSIRFKAVLKRPTSLENGNDASSLTPILKSYKLLMTPKNGL